MILSSLDPSRPTTTTSYSNANSRHPSPHRNQRLVVPPGPSDQRKISSSSYTSTASSASSIVSASGSGSGSRSRRAASASGSAGAGTFGGLGSIGVVPVRASTMPSTSSGNTEMGLAPMSRVSSRGSTTKSEPATAGHGSSPLRQHPLPQSNNYPDIPSQQASEMTGAVTSIDMKRLLSKPALPQTALYHSSDSEHSLPLSSKSLPATSRANSDDARPAKGFGGASASKPVIQVRMKPSLSSPLSASSSTYGQASSPATTSTRGVLKRKPSGPRSPPTSASTKSAPVISAPRPLASNANLTIDAGLSRRALSSNASSSSSPLTPAGAVVEAYKQQEQKRESHSHQASGSNNAEHWCAEDPKPSSKTKGSSPTPYYTVFGGTSGRIVAVGGPSDILLDGYYGDDLPPRPNTKDHSPSPARSLTRKVSARWKKASAGLKGEGNSPDSTEGERGRGDVAASRSGRRSTSLPRERTKSFGHGQSLDLRSPRAEAMVSPQMGTFSRAWSADPAQEDVRAKPGKLVKAKHDREREREKEKEKEEAKGKIWKLMKRISTGGLREKYHSEIAPPVPALPQGFANRSVHQSVEAEGGVLSRFMSSRSSMSATPTKDLQSSSQVGSPLASPSNDHGDPPKGSAPRRSTTTGSTSSPISSDFGSSRFFHRSQSTRSSSSSYGDELPPVPNTKIGQHIIPPSELHRINMQIEAEFEASKPRGPQRSRSAPSNDSVPPPDNSPEATRPSLPFPPRRPATANSQNSPKFQSSPEFPLFSTAGAVNSFKRRTASDPQSSDETDTHGRPHLHLQMPQTEFGISPLTTSPPPRPSKSPRRLHGNSVSIPAHSTTPPATNPLLDDNYDSRYFDARNPNRNSNASTVRQRSTTFNTPSATPRRPTTADSQATTRNKMKSPTSAKSPLNFRALDSGSAKMPLTAKEKADIWDDLLEKSDLAGGTLHIGEQELMSDQMSQMRLESRLSNYTELTDIP